MADPDHVGLARAGANAIARWRELTFRSINTRLPRFDLGYRLEDRAASETFTPEFVYGRPTMDLSGSFLSGIKLPGADLRHDNLSDADLTGCDFRMADLSRANLNGAHLFRASLPRAILMGTQLIGCSLTRANLSGGTLRHAVLKGADLSYAVFSYADLERADLSGADLTAADFSWANLSYADLRGATLTSTSLTMTNLTGADLRGAKIVKSDFESSVLHRAMAGGTLFANCDLRSVIGLDSMLHGAPSHHRAGHTSPLRRPDSSLVPSGRGCGRAVNCGAGRSHGRTKNLPDGVADRLNGGFRDGGAALPKFVRGPHSCLGPLPRRRRRAQLRRGVAGPYRLL